MFHLEGSREAIDPPTEILEENHEARRPFDRRSQPAGRRGDRLRHDGSAGAGGVSCELGPSLGDLGFRPAASLRQTPWTRRQEARRGRRHGPDRCPRDSHRRSGGGAPRARRNDCDRRGRHGLPYTFLAAQARPLRRAGGARSRPQLQLHRTRAWRSRERSRGGGPAPQRRPTRDACKRHP